MDDSACTQNHHCLHELRQCQVQSDLALHRMADAVVPLAVDAAKLIVPPVANNVFSFRKTVHPRCLPFTMVCKFDAWIDELATVESNTYESPGLESRTAVRQKAHEDYCARARG